MLRVLSVLVLGALAGPQKPKLDVCPWCKNDPALMKAAGIVSHGPIPIGPKGSAWIVSNLPTTQWVFLETAHIRWASSLGTCNVEMEDKQRVLAELARLKLVLPTVPDEPKRLDPFLRLHLFAMKGEEFYARFQKLLGVTDADFAPQTKTGQPYMGAGPFLGEKDKFELVIHASRATHSLFTKEFAGVTVPDALRYHLKEQHKMIASVQAEDPDLKKDKWLFPHVVHLLSHLCLCAYKHFNYDPPLWLDEGLALCMEKEIDPASTTLEGEEGGKVMVHGPKDWWVGTRKMVADGDQRRLGQLLVLKELSQLDEDSKLTCWSMLRFLIDVHGEKLAPFLGGVKGQLDEKGAPSSTDLPELQRKLMKDLWGWNPVSFDDAWTTWVRAQK
jgi:hypothetical protein